MDQAFDHIRNSVDIANAKLIEVVAIALVPVFAFVRAAVFRKKLDDAGYDYFYVESDGGHIWRNWRIYLSRFVPLLFR